MPCVVISLSRALGLATALLAALLVMCPTSQAATYQKMEQINIVMIGDRVVDIAYNLGVIPTGMSVRCSLWPLCGKIKVMAQPLGCPGCLSKGKTGKLADFIKTNRIKLAIVEKSHPFCLLQPSANPLDAVEFLQKRGVEVKIVDFGQGVEEAITQTAAILGKPDEGKALLARYQKAVRKLEKATAGQKLGERVVVLNGIYQAQTGKAFIQVQAPGGYIDKFILSPLGCMNVGKGLAPCWPKTQQGMLDHPQAQGVGQDQARCGGYYRRSGGGAKGTSHGNGQAA